MNFNYTLLLILSILLLVNLYIKLDIKLLTSLLLGILLVINELYKKKDTFQDCDNPLLCQQNVNSLFFNNPEIISFAESNIPISNGVECKINKNYAKYQIQKNKLDEQNEVIDMIKKNIISPDKNTSALIKANDLSVFNPVRRHIDNTPCPNTCHLIDNENKCKNEIDYPVNSTIKNNCEAINDGNLCNQNCHCKYDTKNNKCKYNKLGCIWLKSTDKNQPNICRKRCDKYKDKNACLLATGNSITDPAAEYCHWDSMNQSSYIGNCIPKCGSYTDSNSCMSDVNCKVIDNQCVNKCENISSSQLCQKHNYCIYTGGRCQTRLASPNTNPVTTTQK